MEWGMCWYFKCSTWRVKFGRVGSVNLRSLHHKISQVRIITILSRIWCAACVWLRRWHLIISKITPDTFRGTNISPPKVLLKMMFLFPHVGYGLPFFLKGMDPTYIPNSFPRTLLRGEESLANKSPFQLRQKKKQLIMRHLVSNKINHKYIYCLFTQTKNKCFALLPPFNLNELWKRFFFFGGVGVQMQN